MFGSKDGVKGNMSGVEYGSYLSFCQETRGNKAHVQALKKR